MNLKNLENALKVELKKGVTVLGVDTASRTGWCSIRTTEKSALFDYGFIEMDFPNKYFKFNLMIETFSDLIKKIKPDLVVIEDAYLGRNAKGYGTLCRYGMIVYVLSHQQKKEKFFILAIEARANLGLPHNKKKEEVHKALKEKIDLGTDDNDIIDAVILALNGLLKELPSVRNKKSNKATKQRRLFTKTSKRNTKRKKK